VEKKIRTRLPTTPVAARVSTILRIAAPISRR
jgi:hypothetical protein